MVATSRSSTTCFAGILILLSGCSTFERDWEAARDLPPDPVLGRWEGTWLSAANGHKGGLRCLITKEKLGKTQARVHATYACCFSFEYTVELQVYAKEGEHRFEGFADLGWLAGGEYRYEGKISPAGFESTYASESDNGTFRMDRPRR